MRLLAEVKRFANDVIFPGMDIYNVGFIVIIDLNIHDISYCRRIRSFSSVQPQLAF
jgi:hypothetical protein